MNLSEKLAAADGPAAPPEESAQAGRAADPGPPGGIERRGNGPSPGPVGSKSHPHAAGR